MQIECILIRKGGTTVTLGENEYHFAPDAESGGAHVATITDRDHIQRLLCIPEAYRIFGEAIVSPEIPKGPPDVPEMPEPETPEPDGDEPEPEVPADVNKNHVDEVAMTMMTKAELADQYEVVFGERPNAKLTKAMIIDALLKG